ncbi:hypothetical protein [uncultured Nostoc sp.]
MLTKRYKGIIILECLEGLKKVPPILAKAIALHLQEKLELCPKAIGTL